MKYAQLPEDTAKAIHKLLIDNSKKFDDNDLTACISSVSALSKALSEAKPLPKKPGPKPKVTP